MTAGSGVLRINGAVIDATEFAYDGCHKIFLISSAADREKMHGNGWTDSDIQPVSRLPEVWDASCPLRFINRADLTEVVPQCAPEPVITYTRHLAAVPELDPPQLYRLTSVIDDWPHRGVRYNNVKVAWFVKHRDYDPGFDYTKLLDRQIPPGEGPSYEQGCVDELFTRSEADQLAQYLAVRQNTAVDISEVTIPVDGGCLPTGAQCVGGGDDFYMLSEHDDYELPFKAWGYYFIEDFDDKFDDIVLTGSVVVNLANFDDIPF